MYEYISGKLALLEPTRAVIDARGVGYLLEISLNTYDAL
ncbi:MAG: Holliday junction branch migration protein RuvA, partial [Bacteroidales bacterium]|nr:Holliday junction branch migration protein RuvA [Bacteroidales bacterium]